MATQRKDGRYQAKRRINGKLVYRYGRTEIEAERLADQAAGISRLSRKPTLNEFSAEVHSQTVRGKSKKWIDQIKWALDHILPVFGEREIESITRAEIQAFLNDKGRTLSLSSVGHIRKVFFSIMELADADDVIPKNPVRKVTLPTDRREPKRASAPNVGDLRGYLEASKGTRAECFLLLSCTFGLRLGEALGVEPKDYQNGMLRISRQRKGDPVKTKSGYRVVPVPGGFGKVVVGCSEATVIRTLRGLHGRTNLPSGTGILPKGVTIHDLRRAVKSGMARMGVRPAVTAAILGHSRATLDEAYDRAFPDEVRDAIEKWWQALQQSTST